MTKFLRISWWVIVAIVTVVVAFAVLSKASSDFERIVVALLVTIYTFVANGFSGVGQLTTALDRTSLARHMEIRTALGNPPNSDELQSIRELDATLERARIKFYVGAATMGVVSVMALVFLIGAL